MGCTPEGESVFERLYSEKDAKKVKMESLKEEYEVRKETERKKSQKKSRSKSGSKRKASKSPEEFYRKQIQMKIEADRKLAVMMYEKAKKYDTEIRKEQRSRSRKKSELSKKNIPKLEVHDRLFNDVKERSRKRMGLEMNPNNKNYESLGNLSISSLSKCEFKHRNEANRHMASESLYVPKISKNSRKLATPKRDTSTSVNNALYKDAVVRRERQKSERKRSMSKEKEKYSKDKKGTLKTSKKILIKKYLIEFDRIAQKLGVQDEPEAQIHFTQFIMLMQQLGFVSEESESDMDKIKVLWGIIQDQDENEESGHYCRKHSLKVI
jgi:hypothetical protein